MKKISALIIIVSAFFCNKLNAQELAVNPAKEAPKEYSENHIYDRAEIKPEYPGGINEFREFVVNNLNLPDELTESLRLVISFVVEKDGSLTGVKLERNPGYGLAEEFQRIFAASKKWTPGYDKGKPIRTYFRFPLVIQFE